MFVHAKVTFLRQRGVLVQRYALQHSMSGRLQMHDKPVLGRNVRCLVLYPSQDSLKSDQPCPVLFEPKLVEVLEGFRLQGWESTPERAWVLQEWECLIEKTR